MVVLECLGHLMLDRCLCVHSKGFDGLLVQSPSPESDDLACNAKLCRSLLSHLVNDSNDRKTTPRVVTRTE